MSIRPRSLTPIAVSVSLFATLALARVGDELALKEADHKSLGVALRDVTEAKDAAKADKAKKALGDLFARIGKATKRNEKGDPVQVTLSLTNDLARSLYFVEEHKIVGIKPGEIVAQSIDVPGADKPEKITFAVWTPKNYKPSGDALPVVLFVPGMKEGKVYNAKQFLIENWIDGPIREKAFLVAVEMPENTKNWDLIETDDHHQGGVAVVMRVFGKLHDLMSFDVDRVYLAGRETGVATALKIGSMYPQRFAGVIGQSGDAAEVLYDNFRNLPSFFAGGGAACTNFQEKTKAAGFENCTLKQDGKDADAWAWIQEHKRLANPPKVSLLLGDPQPLSAYWIATARQEISPGTRVDAEVDRATNTLTIKTKNVRQVTVFFNDVLLDLDKPVKVVCNGVAHEDKIGRSLEDFTTFVKRGTCDGGRVYVASKVYDVPPAKE